MIRGIAFDAFAVFDIRGVSAVARSLQSPAPDGLIDRWHQKAFAYTWLRTAGDRYKGFGDVLADALDFVSASSTWRPTPQDRDRLLSSFSQLAVWPDVPASLSRFKEQGLELVLLSNMSEGLLSSNIAHNGLEGLFSASISTDRVRAFKPAPAAYNLAVEELGLSRQEIGFAASASWDAVGACWFGYPTAWVNRLRQPAEPVEVVPSFVGQDLRSVDDLLLAADA